MHAFDLISRVREHSPTVANLMLDRLIPRLIPLASGLGVRVRHWAPDRCELTLAVSRRTRNHIGTMYFGAQMTLADLAAGVLIFPQFSPDRFAGVIKTVQADFRAKARGLIRCVCSFPPEARDALEAVRSNETGKAEAWIPLELRDEKDRVVTEVRVLVAIRRLDRR